MEFLMLLVFAAVVVTLVCRRNRRRDGRVMAAGTGADMARSWLLSWWPGPPSSVAVTDRLARWSQAERLPISHDRSIAPTAVVIGLHPAEYKALGGRLPGVELAIAEGMADVAAENGWRSYGRPSVRIQQDKAAALGWPRIQASYAEPEQQQQLGRSDAGVASRPTTPLSGRPVASAQEASTVLSDRHLRLPDGTRVPLPDSGRIVLGRGRGVDVVLLHPQISKQHFALTISGPSVWLEDLGSTNGSYVDGQPISGRRQLKPGRTTIRLGTNGPSVTYEAGGQAVRYGDSSTRAVSS